jgi:pimeloyl-ACP methyl ester carboxylesterase
VSGRIVLKTGPRVNLECALQPATANKMAGLTSCPFNASFPAPDSRASRDVHKPNHLMRPRNKRALVTFLFVALAGFLWTGCQMFIPREIKDISKGLHERAAQLKQNDPAAFRSYVIDGRIIQYVETGPAESRADTPLVLFVHGSPGSWSAWVDYLADDQLRTRARLIAVDRPGFGGSGAGRTERSLEQQVADLRPLLDQRAPHGRVILVGHSYGGPVVARMAMDYPGIVTDVIILAGSIDPGQEHTKWYQYPADWALLRWMVPTPLKVANQEIMPLKGQLQQMLPLWTEIHQRVTVIQGEADDLVPPENADFAQRVMVNAKPLNIIRLPGMNHFIPWKCHGLVAKEILLHCAN